MSPAPAPDAKLDAALGRLGRRISPDGSSRRLGGRRGRLRERAFALAHGHLELELAAVAPDDHLRGLSDRGHRDHIDQVIEIDDIDSREPEDDVAGAQTRLGGR